MDIKPGFTTSEFFAAVGTAIGSIVAVLVVVGYVTAEQADTINQAIADLVVVLPVAIGAFFTIYKVIAGYIQSRTAVKTAAMSLKK